MRDLTIRVPDHVVWRTFANETVLLNIRSGTYHGLNPVAGRMLEVVQERGSLLEAVDVLVAEFEQPVEVIERDLRAFCRSLADRELIELADEPAG